MMVSMVSNGFKWGVPLLALVFLFYFSASTNSEGVHVNKSFTPGELWWDNEGRHINAHGGGMLFHEGTYYWFGEHKTAGSGGNTALVGVQAYSSRDLLNWTNRGVALKVLDEKGHAIESGAVIERPKVVYNELTGKFVMWFHLELKGQGYSAARAGVAVADEVTGPYTFVESLRPNAQHWPVNMDTAFKNQHVDPDIYEWWTPRWNKAVVEGLFVRRDFEGGQMSRDMTVFVDDDGKAYHVFSSEENLTLHIAELSDDYLSHTGKY
ncbi:MAG: beta-glucanase, partial [Bacteroidales bacterium]|nr:beta-glucanase [Bacteroidales bacterium]